MAGLGVSRGDLSKVYAAILMGAGLTLGYSATAWALGQLGLFQGGRARSYYNNIIRNPTGRSYYGGGGYRGRRAYAGGQVFGEELRFSQGYPTA